MKRRSAQASAAVVRRDDRTRELLDTLSLYPEHRERITTEVLELNLSLCDALASRFLGRGVDFDDLQQVARTALWVAIQRFRPGERKSLVSYAVPTITGELKRYFRDRCWVVRPPRRIQDLGSATSRAANDLEQAWGRQVSVREIGEQLGVDQREVAESIIARAAYRPRSLDAPVGESATVGSFVTDGQDIASESTDRLALRRALSGLSPRDRQILAWRFENEYTQSEIATMLGISQMQVSRMIRRMLDSTRELLAPEPLAS